MRVRFKMNRKQQGKRTDKIEGISKQNEVSWDANLVAKLVANLVATCFATIFLLIFFVKISLKFR